MYYLEDREQGLRKYPFLVPLQVNAKNSGMYRTLSHLPTFMRGNSGSGHNSARSVRFHVADDIITHVTSVARAFPSTRS
jgi:hypothetical protein